MAPLKFLSLQTTERLALFLSGDTKDPAVKRIPDTDEKVEDEGEVPDELPSTAESTETGIRR